jgi:GMP synthase-like glutamine amidotransferase
MEKIAIVRNDKGYLGEYISGRLARLLKGKCTVIDAWRNFPHDAEAWSISNNIKGVILSGSLTSVNDYHEWIAEELKFIGRLIDSRLPILGICFGHQMLGKFFGVDVDRKAMRSGLTEIKITKEDALFRGITCFQMPVSHREQLSWLPQDFELLATSDYCRIQAMKHRDSNVYGVQFHPCYDAGVKKIKELGITDMNCGEHEGARVLYNFFNVAGV